MKSVTYYNTQTGAIVSTLIGSDYEIRMNRPEGCDYIEGEYDYRVYYISDARAIEKKQMVVKVEGNVISNLPNPTYVSVEGEKYVVEDGDFEFSSNLPGPYRVVLNSPQFQETEVTLP